MQIREVMEPPGFIPHIKSIYYETTYDLKRCRIR